MTGQTTTMLTTTFDECSGEVKVRRRTEEATVKLTIVIKRHEIVEETNC